MQNASNWNAIIVDDEPHNIGVVELVLDFHGAKSRIASSGVECLQLLEEETPNLLLIDIQMPGMDGIELLTLIRKNELWRHVPAVAVTARVMPGDQQHILDAGFDGYIPKPLNAMSFVDEVKAILIGAYS